MNDKAKTTSCGETLRNVVASMAIVTTIGMTTACRDSQPAPTTQPGNHAAAPCCSKPPADTNTTPAARQTDLAAATTTATTRGENKMKIVNGISNYEVNETNFEALRLALNSMGETFSAGYFHGIAGSAFRIGGICPCAPTCSLAMSPQQLITLLGYDYIEFPYDDANKEGALEKAIDAIRVSIDNGVPVLVWDAFTMCEWDIVTGYDDNEKVFHGRGAYITHAEYQKKPWNNTLNTMASHGVMAIVIAKGSGTLDKRAAEIAAIKEAIRHANDAENTDKLGSGAWVILQGKAAYQRWADDFAKSDYKRSHGDMYCIGVYSGAHAQAGPFLRDIAPNYPDASELLIQAAEHFEKEAELLKQLVPLIGWGTRELDPLRNEQATVLLREAAACYGSAMDILAAAVDKM
ncbi:MAG: hypothetical protein FWE88_05020 [Phycisphaerae bacterium]|nr:hypothetical protein [Phycisphaerae bacterium]